MIEGPVAGNPAARASRPVPEDRKRASAAVGRAVMVDPARGPVGRVARARKAMALGVNAPKDLVGAAARVVMARRAMIDHRAIATVPPNATGRMTAANDPQSHTGEVANGLRSRAPKSPGGARAGTSAPSRRATR